MTQPSDLLISRIRALCHEAINVGEPTALVVASIELCAAFDGLRDAGARLIAKQDLEARLYERRHLWGNTEHQPAPGLREALEKIANECDTGEHTEIARAALAQSEAKK